MIYLEQVIEEAVLREPKRKAVRNAWILAEGCNFSAALGGRGNGRWACCEGSRPILQPHHLAAATRSGRVLTE